MTRPEAGARADIVGATDLARVTQGQSLMAALQHLRPAFLVSHGNGPMVSINGSGVTSLSVLSTIPASDVREVRLIRALFNNQFTAILPNGNAAVTDVIIVMTR